MKTQEKFLQERDLKFIQKVIELKEEYERLTCNTNELFRAELSRELAGQISSYKFRDFLDFLSDAETIARLA